MTRQQVAENLSLALDWTSTAEGIDFWLYAHYKIKGAGEPAGDLTKAIKSHKPLDKFKARYTNSSAMRDVHEWLSKTSKPKEFTSDEWSLLKQRVKMYLGVSIRSDDKLLLLTKGGADEKKMNVPAAGGDRSKG